MSGRVRTYFRRVPLGEQVEIQQKLNEGVYACIRTPSYTAKQRAQPFCKKVSGNGSMSGRMRTYFRRVPLGEQVEIRQKLDEGVYACIRTPSYAAKQRAQPICKKVSGNGSQYVRQDATVLSKVKRLSRTEQLPVASIRSKCGARVRGVPHSEHIELLIFRVACRSTTKIAHTQTFFVFQYKNSVTLHSQKMLCSA